MTLRGRAKSLAPLLSRRHKIVEYFMEAGSALLYELVLAVALSIIFPLTTNALGPSDYGRFTTLYLFAGLAIGWVWASAGVAMVQLLVQRETTLSSSLAAAHRQVLMVAVPAGLIGIAASVVMFGTDVLIAALLIFGTELLLNGWTEMNLSAVYALRGTTAAMRVRLAGPIVRLAVVVILAVSGSITIFTLAMSALAGALVVFAGSTRSIRSLRLATELHGDRTRTMAPKELGRYTLSYGVTIFAFSAQNDADKVVLASFRSSAEVGQYAAAYRLVSTAMMPLRAVSTAVYRRFLAHDDEMTGQHLRRATRLMIPTGAYALLVGLGVFIGKPITERLLGDEFSEAVTITLWLAAFPILRTMADVPLFGLLGLGLNKIRMFLGLAGAGIAIGSYLLFVPKWGWKGALAGTYTSEICMAVAGWVLLIVYERRHDRRATSQRETLALQDLHATPEQVSN